MTNSDLNALGLSFDRQADLYDLVRPSYPTALFDALSELTGLAAGARVLEIGAGTGIATRALAERGYTITAIEPGPAMAALAAHNLSSFPNVEVVVTSFEDWTHPAQPFDLVFSATAFHWLDRATRFARCAAALRHGGYLAIVEYSHVAGGDDDFFAAAQGCYERFVPGTPTGMTLPPWDQQPDTSEITASPDFDLVAVHQIREEIPSTREEYLALMSTYSGNLTLPIENRNRLFDCLGALIDRDFGGEITKAYRHELILARRHQ